jgi:hypothetical protein
MYKYSIEALRRQVGAEGFSKAKDASERLSEHVYNKALQHEATKLRALQCNRCVYIEINEPVLSLHANASVSNAKCMQLVQCSANLTPWRVRPRALVP